MICSILKDVFNGKPKEIGNVDVLDVITFDDAALVGYQISQVKDCYGVVWSQICTDFSCQESVDL